MIEADGVPAILAIDLAAIADNYRLLCRRLGRTRCACVVKADAYGLGMAEVAPALQAAGCGTFFVATVEEGVALRRLLGGDVVYVLDGLGAGGATACVEHDLRPVLNSLGEIDAWAAAGRRGRTLAAGLHIDTGLSRLGLPARELATLADEPNRLDGIATALLASHLACAEAPDHPMNREQLAAFAAACERLEAAGGGRARKGVERSLVASSGIFLGPEFHFDLARPGAALYGLSPFADGPNPMAQVVRLQGKILQVRDVDRGGSVGYGATHRFARPARVATVGIGYADGYLRCLSNRGSAFIGEMRAPVVGRVSMDLVTLDVSGVPAELARPGALVDLIGPRNPADEVAKAAGTIGYEILTALGRRYARRYRRAPGLAP